MTKLLALGLCALLLYVLVPWRLLELSAATLFSRSGLIHTSVQQDQYWNAQDLVDRFQDLGYDVLYQRDLELYGRKAYGVTVRTSHKVVIEEALSWNSRYDTLVHEGGHVLQPALTTRDSECFAEGVATLLTPGSLREHARYLANQKWSCPLTLIVYAPEIYAAATLLEAR